MKKPLLPPAAVALAFASLACCAQAPSWVDADKLRPPADYRQWIYLTSGFDMAYNPLMRMGHDMFDNVFVDPQAWTAFQRTGTWPEGTQLVLESRGARSGSINRVGKFQSTELMGLEAHVKDTARFAGGWAFFAFDGGKPAAPIPRDAECYSCHAKHAAVDTTFVQFYPTLLPIAEARGTLSQAYRDEEKKR